MKVRLNTEVRNILVIQREEVKAGGNKLNYEELHDLCSLLVLTGPSNQRSLNGPEIRRVRKRRRCINVTLRRIRITIVAVEKQ